MRTARKEFGVYAKENVIAQIIGIFIFSVLIFDSGFSIGIWYISCLSYWIGYLFIRVRRPENPSKIDLIFLRFAVLIIFGTLWFGTPLTFFLYECISNGG
jgi:hypothetical protein